LEDSQHEKVKKGREGKEREGGNRGHADDSDLFRTTTVPSFNFLMWMTVQKSLGLKGKIGGDPIQTILVS
jgi:hypothetical protein